MSIINEPVVVWTADDGTPERLVWHGRRYRVTDTATRIEPYWGAMHVPSMPPVWRFQGTLDDESSLVFDVRFDHSSGAWQLIRIFD